VRRWIWAEDPVDTDSPLHYEPEVTDTTGQVWTARSRVLAVLGQEAAGLATKEIGDLVAADGKGQPLAKRTIQNALKGLQETGEVDGEQAPGVSGKWWRT
jgi:hypothetical protein